MCVCACMLFVCMVSNTPLLLLQCCAIAFITTCYAVVVIVVYICVTIVVDYGDIACVLLVLYTVTHCVSAFVV